MYLLVGFDKGVGCIQFTVDAGWWLRFVRLEQQFVRFGVKPPEVIWVLNLLFDDGEKVTVNEARFDLKLFGARICHILRAGNVD